jgi:hypothetical protein
MANSALSDAKRTSALSSGGCVIVTRKPSSSNQPLSSATNKPVWLVFGVQSSKTRIVPSFLPHPAKVSTMASNANTTIFLFIFSSP